MKAAVVAVLAFLAIITLTYAQEQQGVTPQWFIPHPWILPHPYILPHPHLPLPHFPSLPPTSAPHWPFQHPSNPSSPAHPSNPSPAHDNLGPCADDLHSFLTTHKLALSSACCSALKNVKIPPVQRLVSLHCSGGSPPSA